MAEKQQTMKVWAETLRRLRLIAGATGESLVSLIDRLSREELERKAGLIKRLAEGDK